MFLSHSQGQDHDQTDAGQAQMLAPVGFSYQPGEPTDQEIRDMVDDVIAQVLGPQGLAAIVKPGDKVVIKVNIVAVPFGARGEKGRGGITDPRIVRYVAEKVRDIIGFDAPADLKVIDATFYTDHNPSLKSEITSFYWARLERSGDNAVDEADVGYDADGDGILDGTSRAKLVNADSLDLARRSYRIRVADSEDVTVNLPKLIQTYQEAEAEGSDEYCDVLIGLPVFKSHGLVGITGALKLQYGLRHYLGMPGDSGRYGHDGMYIDETGFHNKQAFLNYLCAQQLVRKYDLIIMDCLTGNREGPLYATAENLMPMRSDEPIDYILTNAMLASRDPVAIDTVETILAGYDPKSIGLLETARRNGLGTDDPQWIDLGGYKSFFRHRQWLYDHYSHDQYPFEDNWGEARIRDNYQPTFTVDLNGPRPVEEGIYALDYQVESTFEPDLKLVRVELFVGHERRAFYNADVLPPGAVLEKGTFVADLGRLGYIKGSAIPWMIALWDEGLNCVFSRELIARYE